MIFTALLALLAPCTAAPLKLRIVDEAGQPVWARLEIYGADGKPYQPPNVILDPRSKGEGEAPGYRASFILRGECALDVPPGEYRVIAERGLEHERIETTAKTGENETRIRIAPWIRMRKRGWYSADFHVHRAIEHAAALAQAEDVNLIAVFTMWNKRNLWEGKPLPASPVLSITPNHIATIMNAEDERGGGAWMLHQIPEPLALGVEGRWFPPGIEFVRQARARRARGAVFPWFDLEKLIWWEVPVIMALEPADSLGLLHNHYQQYQMMDNEAWGRPRDKAVYPGLEGFSLYTTELYYRYLNLGFRLPPSAGSASGVLQSPVGYNRIYTRLDKPLTAENWYSAYRSGPSFVTNGPMLFFEASTAGSRGKARIRVHAREPLDRVELVANGRILQKFTMEPGAREWTGEAQFDPRAHTWIAARSFLKTSATVRMAHSSPVYLKGKWDASEDARFFLGWIDALIMETEKDAARFRNERERDEVLALYRKARSYYVK
jgi:hypothetical protein